MTKERLGLPHLWHTIMLTVSLHFVEFLLSKSFQAPASDTHTALANDSEREKLNQDESTVT